MQTIEKRLRDKPTAAEAAALLPALVDAVQTDQFEAIPLLEQALEQAAPGAVERHDWPSVAEALKTAARARFEQIETDKAGRHLQTLLALYRDVADARSHDADGPWRRLRQIHEVTAEYLRGEQTSEALAVLAEGADLDLPYRHELDDGRAALAGALNRRLVQLSADERYELLYAWTMPTQSRRTLRVFSSLAPVEAPPAAFARALGERPRSDSFPIAEIGGVPGLFSTAWSLISAAAETGRLRGLTSELQTAADEKLPHAEFALLLAKIAAVDAANGEDLAAELLKFVASLAEAPADNPGESQANGADDLSSLLLAAACLSREPSRSAGGQLLDALTESAAQQRPTPMLRRARAVAMLKRVADAAPRWLDDPNLAFWLPTAAESAEDAARTAAGAIWLAHEDHIFHLAGQRHDYLCFRYPLSGEFQFRVDVQEGVQTGGGLALGGLSFGIEAAQLAARVGNLDLIQERLRPFPFVRQEAWPTFQRLEISSNGRTMQFRCNGHPAWSEMPADLGSPWLALRCGADRVTAFRNLHLIGEPAIPRQVELCAGDSLRGWFSHYYPAAVSTSVPLGGVPLAERTPASGFDWSAQQGEIHGAQRPDHTAPLPSRLTYFRPLADGETLDYEFFYEPGKSTVHPTLGRLAFLLDPGGVQVHWLTSGAKEWTGLDESNAILEPLNRRGPKPLPLKISDWNRVTISLAKGTATIALNGTAIYVRKLEAENPRTFSFYHDRRRTAARIRKVILQGDWPERLTEQQLASLTAPRDAALAGAMRPALGAIFSERHVPDSALFAHRRAAALPPEARYAWLADWVLPGEDHAGLRLALDFTPTHPAPPVADDSPLDVQRVAQAEQSGDSRIQTGGNLVAPALELVEVAQRLGKLDEVRRRVEQAPQTDDWSRRARLAMLAIVDMAREQPNAANESLDKLLALLEAGDHTDFSQRWPETLATHAALFNLATRNAGRNLAYHLLLRQLRGGPDGGSDAWRRYMAGLVGLIEHLDLANREDDALQPFAADPQLRQWRPASRTTAQSRGLGFPPCRYHGTAAEARVEHLVGHNLDYLYFQSPLRGDFEAEYDVPGFGWRDTQLVIGGWWVSPIYDLKTYAHGTYRSEAPRRSIVPPLTKPGLLIHSRTVARQGASQSFANGRLLHTQRLSDHCDPWLAIRNIGRFSGSAENVRLTGRPEIPEELCLSDHEGLTGWSSYYEGMPGGPNAWQAQGDLSDGGSIIGSRAPELAGTFAESVFVYHRPMFEDGVIEYEFYCRPGEIGCHPALDRLAFLLEPTGVRIHWITDGAYDRTQQAADHSVAETDCRRGPERLPLESEAWNRLALEAKGDVVRLRLNGQLVYERKLEPSNQRTFGLFHYADQTQALVRRVMWRGAWPRELPPVSEQELAGKYGDFLDARRAELPATFEHDFARQGFPLDQFTVREGGNFADLSPQPDGLHVGCSGPDGYRRATIAPQLTIEGDFDVMVSYERFAGAPANNTTASLILQAAIDKPALKEFMLYRRVLGREDGLRDQVLLASTAWREGAETRREFTNGGAFEATSGRLRLARRDDMIYFLAAEGDSPHFRLIHTKRGAADALAVDGLRLMAQVKAPGRVDVVWTKLVVRAERLSGLAVENSAELVKQLDRRRDALAGRFLHDFTHEELTVEKFHRWGFEPVALPQPGGLQIAAEGDDAWRSVGLAPHVVLSGDFDIAADIAGVRFDPPKPGENSAVYLQVELPAESSLQYSLILLEYENGRRELVAQLRRQTANGSFENSTQRRETSAALQRLRIARRGEQMLFLYSDDLSQHDGLLARFDVSDVDVADPGVRLFLHAGGAGKKAEVRVKRLSIHSERATITPAVSPPAAE
ncbi:MAG TPA: DUF1583 domain-containing protein [Pirellulales bacterium]|nr:DUF1583 domain-containing protein [Pirellulales bacterium]